MAVVARSGDGVSAAGLFRSPAVLAAGCAATVGARSRDEGVTMMDTSASDSSVIDATMVDTTTPETSVLGADTHEPKYKQAVNSGNARALEFGLNNCIRCIEEARPDKQLGVLKNMASEVAEYVRQGLDEATALDRINAAALRCDIVHRFGLEAVHSVLHAAFSSSSALKRLSRASAPSLIRSTASTPASGSFSPPAAADRFRLIPFGQLLSSTSPEALIAGLIPRVGLTVVWGPYKCGKSFWLMDALLHVSLGWDYRGRKVFPGPVVYCAFEGAEGYKKRNDAFSQHYDLAIVPPFFLVAARMNFVADHGALIDAIRAQLGDQTPVCVVLDTLNRSLHGSENNDVDMAAYIQAADAVREAFGCAVIIVHHSGIDGSRPRGHTSLTAAADAQLAIRRDANDIVTVKVEWMKDGPEGAQITSQLKERQVGIDKNGAKITSCVVLPIEDVQKANAAGPRLTSDQRTMLTTLQAAGQEGLSLEAWNDRARDAGIGKTRAGKPRNSKLYDLRKALTDKGLIQETATGWKANQP
ncbi:MAG: AAA family ATPase [Alphaproteobacteria bacterium]|nr:AAA family ATPase [Alphaproteobacteria bacterium]